MSSEPQIYATTKWMRTKFPDCQWVEEPVFKFVYADGREAFAMMLTEEQREAFERQQSALPSNSTHEAA